MVVNVKKVILRYNKKDCKSCKMFKKLFKVQEHRKKIQQYILNIFKKFLYVAHNYLQVYK